MDSRERELQARTEDACRYAVEAHALEQRVAELEAERDSLRQQLAARPGVSAEPEPTEPGPDPGPKRPGQPDPGPSAPAPDRSGSPGWDGHDDRCGGGLLSLLPLLLVLLLGACAAELPHPSEPPALRWLEAGRYEVRLVYPGAQVHRAQELLQAQAAAEAERLGVCQAQMIGAEEKVPPPKPGGAPKPPDGETPPPPEPQTTVIGTLTCSAAAPGGAS